MTAALSTATLPRPESGDVVELIVADHVLFEALLRALRDATADRETARRALADLLLAHELAEEEHVYPSLRAKRAITAHEEEHGEEEHAEGDEALLALLECVGTDTQKFDDAVEELAELLNHHIGEEEQTILNGARTDLSDAQRDALGRTFAAARNDLLDQALGTVENVRARVAKAEREGKLDEDDDEDE